MFGLGLGEFLVVAFVVLLIFGGKKLPALGKALGESVSGFKKEMKDGKEKLDQNNDPSTDQKE